MSLLEDWLLSKEPKILTVWHRTWNEVLHEAARVLTDWGKVSATVFMRESYFRTQCRRCTSRDSTNQNASFVELFSRSERAVFRGICGEIFALFQACVGNFDTIPPWKVVGILYLDSSCVTLKYFAFLSVCDKFELLGHVQAAMII